MHWNSLADFLAMGNHGLYVWGSVAVMALLMLAEPILLLQGRKKLIAASNANTVPSEPKPGAEPAKHPAGVKD
jgi:heme exporter protein D